MQIRPSAFDSRLTCTDWSWQGCTPLHWAATTDSEEAVRLLLAHNADCNIKDATGSSSPVLCCMLMVSVGIQTLLNWLPNLDSDVKNNCMSIGLCIVRLA